MLFLINDFLQEWFPLFSFALNPPTISAVNTSMTVEAGWTFSPSNTCATDRGTGTLTPQQTYEVRKRGRYPLILSLIDDFLPEWFPLFSFALNPLTIPAVNTSMTVDAGWSYSSATPARRIAVRSRSRPKKPTK